LFYVKDEAIKLETCENFDGLRLRGFFVGSAKINICIFVSMFLHQRKKEFSVYSKRVFARLPGAFNVLSQRGPVMNSNSKSEFFVDDLLHEQEHRFGHL
jgi:hypothetical protein